MNGKGDRRGGRPSCESPSVRTVSRTPGFRLPTVNHGTDTSPDPVRKFRVVHFFDAGANVMGENFIVPHVRKKALDDRSFRFVKDSVLLTHHQFLDDVARTQT